MIEGRGAIPLPFAIPECLSKIQDEGIALKKIDNDASLGWLFIAVQLVDIIFFPLVLLGVEHFRIVPHYTASTHFELYDMPYTHSRATLGNM